LLAHDAGSHYCDRHRQIALRTFQMTYLGRSNDVLLRCICISILLGFWIKKDFRSGTGRAIHSPSTKLGHPKVQITPDLLK
jgi:hypothetical protein